VGHASRSSGLFHMEASQGRVFQSALKTGEGAAVGGARGTITRLRQSQVKDGWVDATGCIRLFYHTFVVFNILCPRGIVVIYSLD
jgi:hypothetical protein